MRAIAIKLKSYRGGVSIVNNNDLQKRIFASLITAMGVLALVYLFVLGTMVYNIVERKTLEAEARNMSNDVSSLELQYLSMSNKIDLTFSHSLGFTETKANFATRKNLGSLTVEKNEI